VVIGPRGREPLSVDTSGVVGFGGDSTLPLAPNVAPPLASAAAQSRCDGSGGVGPCGHEPLSAGMYGVCGFGGMLGTCIGGDGGDGAAYSAESRPAS